MNKLDKFERFLTKILVWTTWIQWKLCIIPFIRKSYKERYLSHKRELEDDN